MLAPHCAEDAPIFLLDAEDGPCHVGTQGWELAAGQHLMLGHRLLAIAALGVGAGGGPDTSSSPGPCCLSVGICSGRCAEGALWAGASGQTVNTAKQAGLSAALLAAGHEKITPGKRCGCGARGAGCHSGTQPTCHPGYFSTHSQDGRRAGDGSHGVSGEGERLPLSLVSPGRWGEQRDGMAQNRLLWVGFFG